MEQVNSVRTFKNLLKNYKEYKKIIEELNDEIDNCYLMLGGLKGYDPAKVVVHSPKNLDFEYQTREKIDELEINKRFYQSVIDHVDDVLKRMDEIPLSDKIDVKQALIDIYIEGNKFSEVCEKKYYITATGLMKLINKAIEKALN